MFLVELVLQGVRGFRELVRMRFKGSFNVISAGNESGKTTAVESMRCLLFPKNQPALLETLISRQAPDDSRAALVMCSDKGAYYRIIQDFSKRAVNLSQYDAASKNFNLLHKDWDATTRFMAGMTSEFAEEDFAGIFFYSRERGAIRLGATAAVAAPRLAPTAPISSAGKKASSDRERLAALRETLRKAEEAADAEYKFQSAKLALDEVEKKIASLEEIEQKRTEMESTLESLKGYENLPENLNELIDAQERRQGQKLAEEAELDKRLDGLKMQSDAMPTTSVVTSKLFIAGAAVGGVSILAGVFMLTERLAFLFPLGVLLSLALMTGAWYIESQKSMQRKNVLTEEENLKAQLAELEKRFQQEGADITASLRSTGASSTAELKEKSENYRYFRSLRENIEEERLRSLGDLNPESLQQQRVLMQQEVVKLEKAAQEVSHNNVDTFSLRQDIERLDTDAAATIDGPSWNLGDDLPEPSSFIADPVAGGGGGGFLSELTAACRVGGIEMGALVPAVEAAAQRNLAAVTAGKYVRLEAGGEGDPVVYDKEGLAADYAKLSHGTRGLVTFCLRTGLVEALAGKRRFPFILDDPLVDFDPARQTAACQILRALGAKTQVILFTSNPALKAEGDATAELI